MFAVQYEPVVNPEVWDWIRYTPSVSRSGDPFVLGDGSIRGWYKLVGDSLAVRWIIEDPEEWGAGDLVVGLPEIFEIDPNKMGSHGFVEDYEDVQYFYTSGETDSAGITHATLTVLPEEGIANWETHTPGFATTHERIGGSFTVPVKDPFSNE